MTGAPGRSLIVRRTGGVAVGIFAMRRSAAPPAAPEVRAELPEGLPAHLAPVLAAVGEALASEADPVDACAVAGLELALAGVSLDEALVGLESISRLVHGRVPSFAATRALAAAWSDATLGYLHRLDCADPMTGLASLAHLQSRIPELYRGELRGRPRPGESHALVVVDVGRAPLGEALATDLRLAATAEIVTRVFAAGEPMARAARDRLVVLADRDDHLARRVRLVTTLLADQPGRARVWIEGLPETDTAAAALLVELALC